MQDRATVITSAVMFLHRYGYNLLNREHSGYLASDSQSEPSGFRGKPLLRGWFLRPSGYQLGNRR
jgi:hypothetical protein